MNKRGDYNLWDLRAKLKNAAGDELIFMRIQLPSGLVVEAAVQGTTRQPLSNVDSEIIWLEGKTT